MSDAIYTDLNEVPSTAGVYMLASEDGKDVYVGSTKNLRKRFSQWRRDSRFHPSRIRRVIEDGKRLCFSILRQCSDAEARIIEAELLKRCNPSLNEITWIEWGHIQQLACRDVLQEA